MALLSRSFHVGGGRRGRYFFGNRGLSKRITPFPGLARPEYFLRLSGRAQAFAFQQEADQCIRPCRPCFIS